VPRLAVRRLVAMDDEMLGEAYLAADHVMRGAAEDIGLVIIIASIAQRIKRRLVPEVSRRLSHKPQTRRRNRRPIADVAAMVMSERHIGVEAGHTDALAIPGNDLHARNPLKMLIIMVPTGKLNRLVSLTDRNVPLPP
jgi:hypothetical protein